jgi:Protein phosphatase 2C
MAGRFLKSRFLSPYALITVPAAYVSSSSRNVSNLPPASTFCIHYHLFSLLTQGRPVHALCQQNIGGATYPANNPTEDRFLYHKDPSCNLVAVMDGHGGWQVSNYVSQSLISELKAKQVFDMSFQNELEVGSQLRRVFQDLEDGYLDKVREAYRLGFGGVASVGCCTLVAIQKGEHLIVANCGDCRAVLGCQYAVGGKYSAVTITKDHNCRELLEQVKRTELPSLSMQLTITCR